MKRYYRFSGLLFLICSVSVLFAQPGSSGATAGAPSVSGRYQMIELDPAKPCNCNEKTPRYFEMYQAVQEQDIRQYRMIAYKFSFGPSIDQASKLFRALEQDPAVMKISIREWDYFMLFTTDEFDAASFDTAAGSVFGEISAITPADFFLYKNASLLKIYRAVFPAENTIPSTSN
jgi:hypothetical protein